MTDNKTSARTHIKQNDIVHLCGSWYSYFSFLSGFVAIFVSGAIETHILYMGSMGRSYTSTINTSSGYTNLAYLCLLYNLYVWQVRNLFYVLRFSIISNCATLQMPHPFSNEFSRGNKPPVKFWEIVEHVLYRKTPQEKSREMHKTSGVLLLVLFKALKDSRRLQVWIEAQVKWLAEHTIAGLSKGSMRSTRFTAKVPATGLWWLLGFYPLIDFWLKSWDFILLVN